MLLHTETASGTVIRLASTKGATGAVWRCSQCQAWWGAQLSDQPATSFSLQLPEEIAAGLPGHAYRGWKERNESFTLCPQCGQWSGRLVCMVG